MAVSEESIRTILKSLESMKFFSSLYELERESGVKLRSYGKEIDFFYEIVMEGRFEDIETFISPLLSRNQSIYNKVAFAVRKQEFLEKLENSSDPQLEELVKLLKDIEKVASPNEFSSLCTVLSLNKLTDHQDFTSWTSISGRRSCFQDSVKSLSEVYPIAKVETNEVLCETGNMRSPKTGTLEIGRYFQDTHEDFSEIKDEGVQKKVKFWKPADKSSDDDSRNIFIEALNSDEEEVQEMEEESEEVGEIKQSKLNLMEIFEPEKLREMAKVEDTKPIRCSAFNVSGDYFVLGTNSNSIKVCSLHNIVDELLYNEHQGREQYIDVVFEFRKAHLGSVYCIDWARSEKQIASGSNDRTIKIFYCPNFLQIQESQSETLIYEDGKYLNGEGSLPPIQEKTLWGHENIVRTLCYNPVDDLTLLSGGIGEGTLFQWNTETGQIVNKFQGHSGSIFHLAAEGTGSYFVSVATDKKLKVWDLRASKAMMTLNGESFAEMNSVCLSNSFTQTRADAKNKLADMFLKKEERKPMTRNHLAAVGHLDGVVSLWDITAGKLMSKYNYHTADCRSLEFSCDTNWLVSCSFDGSLGFVNMKSGKNYKIEFHDDRVVSIKWHPYLPILLSTSADRTARILSL
jgi:WD40 repeat protein